MLAANWRNWAFVITALSLLLLAFLYWKDYMTSDRTVALFTAVLSAIALVQWWTTLRQLRQTDAMIEQDRLRLQGFFSIGTPVVDELIAGQPVKYRYSVRNVGMAPATIIRARSGIIEYRPEDDLSVKLDDFAIFRPRNRIAIAMHVGATHKFPPTRWNASLDATKISQFSKNELRIAVAVVIVVKDILDRHIRVRRVFRYRGAGKACHEHEKYGEHTVIDCPHDLPYSTPELSVTVDSE